MNTLYALYNRSRFSEDDFKDIVGPMFKPETVILMKQVHQSLRVDPTNIDDSKYAMLKRLSEVSSISQGKELTN